MQEVPIWEKINLTIEEAAALSNIGLGKLRELTKMTREAAEALGDLGFCESIV